MSQNFQSPIASAKGDGSAQEGSHHWYVQRLTGIALVPLSLYFIYSLVTRLDADYVTMIQWLSEPLVSCFMILLVAALFYHAYLGLQVVIEDYVHGKALKYFMLIFCQLLFLALAVLSVVFLIQITILGFQVSV